jgi:hypothetical protein
MGCDPHQNSLNVPGEVTFQTKRIGKRIAKSNRMKPKNQRPGHERFAREFPSSVEHVMRLHPSTVRCMLSVGLATILEIHAQE